MNFEFYLRSIVLQPITLCNIDCKYCYLSERDKNLKMPPVVPQRVAESLADSDSGVKIIWHGGEPLSCGITHFSALVAPLDVLQKEKIVTHVIQTNATLIDERWCEFFASRDFSVGISLDGPAWANKNRVDWGGKEMFDRIVRGAQFLKAAGIDFTVIAVAGGESLLRAKELYEFFCNLGCSGLGINIEEKQGMNERDPCDDAALIIRFWNDLFNAWKENPKIEIREFRRILRWMEAVSARGQWSLPETQDFDIFPTIGFNGDVVFLSPEFLGANAPRYSNFVVGNVCNESLISIVEKGKRTAYVQEFLRGVTRCSQSCKYFACCRGGQASNKFFELGTVDGTETVFCRNTEQRPVEVILANL